MHESTASAYLSYYWGGAMIGRFLGAVSLSKAKGIKKILLMLLLACIGFILIFTTNYKLHNLDFAHTSTFLCFMLLNLIGFYFGKGIPSRLLAVFACANIVLLSLSMMTAGSIALWSLLSIGLFNSIMWSNVFTLAIDGLKDRTAEASSILIMMILGGAILPPLQGVLADNIGIKYSFFVPMISYAYLLIYGLKTYKKRR